MQPILNVLLSKTIDQSLLEVEEETELAEIRAYKQDYSQRQEQLRENWEEEVKREIQRIKHKNKALKSAKVKREQQIKTMHKLQCLNMSKQFLSGCMRDTLSTLASHNYWRDTFSDQLSISFKHFLVDKAMADANHVTLTESVLDGVIVDELTSLNQSKQAIRAAFKSQSELKEATRVIESKTRRIVHYVFNPKVVSKQTPFTKYFDLFMSGDLDAAILEEKDKFTNYIERMVDEALEEGEQPPIAFADSTHLELEVTGIDNIAFAVANNPFFKLDQEKYYPEAVVVNGEGQIVSWLGGGENSNVDNQKFPSLQAMANFRDDKIKINDDRKICMRLSEFT